MSILKIGVLLPASRMFPRADQDFLAGLRGALVSREVEHELAIELTGNAADAGTVTERIQRLLLQHRPQVVVGIVGSALLRHVHSFFSDARTPFIVNNLGAEPLLDGGARNPFVFHNSYNLWQSTYALGWWAARELGPRAGLAVGYHESGFGIVSAFCDGFAEAGGGSVVHTEVTHRASSDEDPSAAVQRIRECGPDFVMGLYAGRSALSFVRAYGESDAARSLPLIGSAFLPHRQWLAEMGEAAVGIRTAFSWNASLRPVEHREFVDACARVDWTDPDAFALLGYETGLALAAAARSAADQRVTGELVREMLPSATIASPRGDRSFDEATGEMPTTDFLLEVRSGGGGGLRTEALGPLDLPERYRADYLAFKSQELRSGWLNPYMIT